jgi:hypothetical protein
MKAKRTSRERDTIVAMIRLYCRHHHGSKDDLCADCRELQTYALARLEHCRYGENKPTCQKCPTHCYKPDRREQIRTVMRFAGPRMLRRHPILALAHLRDSLQ